MAGPCPVWATRKRRNSSGIAHRRREADDGRSGREAAQPRETERQEIAAFRGDDRVQFVEHDAPQRREQGRRVGAGDEQGELFGRRQQDVGRRAALALPFGGRGVAGAGLDAHGKPHFGDGNFEIARHVDGERLQRRDVERVQRRAARARPLPSSTSDGRKPASVLPAPVGAISKALSPASARARRAS